MDRSVDRSRPESDASPLSGPFAAQLALARVHPELAPLCRTPDGYGLLTTSSERWFELRSGQGLAGYGLSRALRILLDVLTGVAALHDTPAEGGEGFVHGELVPALIRVDPRGVARLLPLAPWHWSKAPVSPLPERQGHLAPERLLGDAVDRRADVFSAGVLLWEALAGRRLFEHDSPDAILTRLLGGKVLLPTLPPELAWAAPLKAVAMRALSVDPAHRFPDCAALGDAIRGASHGHLATHAEVAAFFRVPALPALARTFSPERVPWANPSSLSALVAPATPATPLSEPGLEPEADVAATPRPRSRTGWAVAALVLVAAGLSVVAFTRRSSKPAMAREAEESRALPAAAAVPEREPLPQLVPPAAPPPVRSAAPLSPSATAEPAPVSREVKGRATPKGARAAPVAPTRLPRTHDKEAEHYGI